MVASFLRSRYIFFPVALALAALTILVLRLDLRSYTQLYSPKSIATPEDQKPEPEREPEPQRPEYKDIQRKPPIQIPEYFPAAAKAKSSADLPPVPSWNRPPTKHVPEETRLYIGFTRYWPLLQQVVVSYIAAGWPPEDIYVVENTGTMDANKNGRLTPQNPFYMDYNRLTKIFGVNVITTPSLQTFAQLQNFYLSEAINNKLLYYFWGHMDVVVQSHEEKKPYKSFYMRAVDTIRETQVPGYRKDDQGREGRWGIQFFAYDWLALVNVAAFEEVGGWDTMVSYYGTDCDLYARLGMSGLTTPNADAGEVYDVNQSLEDLEILYRRKPKNEPAKSQERQSNSTSSTPPSTYVGDTVEDTPGSERFKELRAKFEAMSEAKKADPRRNSWQTRQSGGKGEPYYYDPDGFEQALQWTIDNGVRINEEKWGHKGCNIGELGLKIEDQWKVKHDKYVSSSRFNAQRRDFQKKKRTLTNICLLHSTW